MPKTNKLRTENNLQFEKALWDKGVSLIAGVDEVGRGALAGPMVVCALILKQNDLLRVYELLTNNDIGKDSPEEQEKHKTYLQIADSKLLTPKKRDVLNDFILKNCVCYSIYQVTNQDIDDLGLSVCTQKAFSGAVKSLTPKPEHILTDSFTIKDFPQVVQTNITAGDRASMTISAASIVAKVFRDKLMRDLGRTPEFAMYDLAKHKGYGTKLHLQKISQHGVSALHRTTFIH